MGGSEVCRGVGRAAGSRQVEAATRCSGGEGGGQRVEWQRPGRAERCCSARTKRTECWLEWNRRPRESLVGRVEDTARTPIFLYLIEVCVECGRGGPTVAVFGSSCTTSRGCQWLPVVCRVLGAAGDGDDEIKIGPGRACPCTDATTSSRP